MPRGIYVRRPWMRTYGKAHIYRDRILQLAAAGLRVSEIARAVGCSRHLVAYVLRLSVGTPRTQFPDISVL